MDAKPYDFTQRFENKTESELQALKEPPGLPTLHLFRWRKERDAAVAALRLAREARENAEQEALAAKRREIAKLVAGRADRLAEEQGDARREEKPVQMPSAASRADESDRALAAAIAEPFAERKPAEILPPRPVLVVPKGNVADLLERQIAICAALIGNVAEHVADRESDTVDNFTFMCRISEMLASSANAARVVGQLRGIASETKQTFVKRTEGSREGGVP